ncbi:MAG: hypothetical protein E7620_06970 [Ruminococcaceae bacterium]|nr:hypothetical protein [Oscillospiraceae bacterium]
MKTKETVDTKGSLGHSPIHVTVLAIVAALIGVFFFILEPLGNLPVERENSLYYSGAFAKYETGRNYSMIYLEDGTSYEIYPHTEPEELRERLEAMEAGTPLELWVNPNTNCLAEIRANGEVLLEFASSQEEVYTYGYGYVGIGIFVCVAAVFWVCYTVVEQKKKKTELDRRERSAARVYDSGDTVPLRSAAPAEKQKILLSADHGVYRICYRRVGKVNELIVNGRVYDEYKALVEFEHALCAIVDGHEIEAGLTADSNSYILFDDEILAEKKRWI